MIRKGNYLPKGLSELIFLLGEDSSNGLVLTFDLALELTSRSLLAMDVEAKIGEKNR